MNDPYKLDPKALRAKTRQASEEHLVTLQDDSSKPPPTIGTAPWQGIIFGPAFGQPSAQLETPSTLAKIIWRVALVAGALAVLVALVRALIHGF